MKAPTKPDALATQSMLALGYTPVPLMVGNSLGDIEMAGLGQEVVSASAGTNQRGSPFTGSGCGDP